ncbi:type 1 fimbrial protein [Providencia stuartii]|nr:type 1 fimbrial protein [Providencia stuartii]
MNGKERTMTQQKLTQHIRNSLLACLFAGASSLSAFADDNNRALYRPVDNWNTDGQHGVLYVSGSLTESPCRLAMTSSYQSVLLGNAETADFKGTGGQGRPIPFQIELLDCLETPTSLENVQTGQTAWSSTQPAVKVRFLAPTVPFMPNYARVNGAQGIGLVLSDSQGQTLPLGEESNPVLLASGQDKLTYYVTPVRTSGPLEPGAYSALIAFEMIYE